MFSFFFIFEEFDIMRIFIVYYNNKRKIIIFYSLTRETSIIHYFETAVRNIYLLSISIIKSSVDRIKFS